MSPIHSRVTKLNWFVAHWRGEASLGIACWLNGLLLGYLLPALVAIGYSLVNPLRHHLRADAAVVLIITALQLAFWVVATPPANMWYPTEEALKLAGVLN